MPSQSVVERVVISALLVILLISFETKQLLDDFKAGNFAFSGQVSGVVLASGAAANANYRLGVAVFTAEKGGLMLEASLGGQKFSYTPFEKKK